MPKIDYGRPVFDPRPAVDGNIDLQLVDQVRREEVLSET